MSDAQRSTSSTVTSRDGRTSFSGGGRARRRRRWLLAGVLVVTLAVIGVVLRGDPPSPVLVDDAVDRVPGQGDVLVPWGTLPPSVRTGSGVATSSTGEVLLLHRGGAPFASDDVMTVDPVLVLDADTGDAVAAWGSDGFRSPHSISVDHRDRVWVTDVMTNQVTVHDMSGRLLHRIGHDYPTGLDTCLAVRNALTNLPCTGDPLIFARPTDVAVAADGDAYVSDGYRNSRVAGFSRDGGFMRDWGGLGETEGEFNIPHGITLLPDGAVAVADRRNARVQVFAPDGGHRATYASARLGRPYDVATGPDGTLYVLDGGDALDEDDGEHRGHVLALDSHGTITRRWTMRGQDADPHQLAIGPRGEIYVAALNDSPLWRWAPVGPSGR